MCAKAKNILVINSSPRKKGNTAALVEAMKRACEEKGHTVTVFQIAHMDIRPCLGCYLCRKGKGDPCIQKDEMNILYKAIKACDTIVLAAPLYWWQFNAHMKMFIDRLCGIAVGKGIPIKECAMILAAGDVSEHNFINIVDYYHNYIIGRFNWVNKGMVLADGIDNIGDAEKSPYMEEAKKLGQGL